MMFIILDLKQRTSSINMFKTIAGLGICVAVGLLFAFISTSPGMNQTYGQQRAFRSEGIILSKQTKAMKNVNNLFQRRKTQFSRS
jgi:hypothetical protein